MARTPALVWGMVAVIAAVAAIAYWDGERESSAALEDFAQEQVTLARGVAAALQARVEEGDGLGSVLARGLGAIEKPGAVRVLLRPPGAAHMVGLAGQDVDSAPLESGLDGGRAAVRLSREQAAAVGLPPRTAVAGFATVDAGPDRRWGVAVVANAQRLRDRERRARWRLVLATLLAGGLVLGFGGAALRRQRRKMDLERELAVAEIQRQQDERLERSDRAATLGTFAMGIAHEIATPLGIISGRAEQLERPLAGDERSSRAVHAILEQTERIHQVIRAFLGLARGEAPLARDLPAPDLGRRAMALCEHRFARAGVTLEADFPDGGPTVRGDPNLLEQALVNLLLNACDACDRGGHVRLSVETGDGVAFVIADDGVGIATADAARATEPFFTTKPKGAGTGLGLAIVSEIAKLHRGSLTIAPRQPRGTVARLVVPAAAPLA